MKDPDNLPATGNINAGGCCICLLVTTLGQTMLKTAYLVLFNIASCLGWIFLLRQTLQQLYLDQDLTVTANKLWGVIGQHLQYVQTMALLEVLHALFGLVRSPVGSTMAQGRIQVSYPRKPSRLLVSSRLWIVLVVNVLCPESRYHWGYVLMVLRYCAPF